MAEPGEGNEWKSFDELVTWAVWEVISQITKGQPLHRTMHSIVQVVRLAKFKEK